MTHRRSKLMYIELFFFHCLFNTKSMHAKIHVYSVNMVNPNIFIVYPHMYIYIQKFLEKTTVELNDFFFHAYFKHK